MILLRNEHGFAMLTVFLIGVISMVLVSTMFFVLNIHTGMSGKDKRYQKELEAAKGASQYIMAALRDDSMTCNNSFCGENEAIDIHGSICNAMGKTQNCSGLTATLLSKTTQTSTGASIYAIEVVSNAANTPEKAIVQFVYKLQ